MLPGSCNGRTAASHFAAVGQRRQVLPAWDILQRDKHFPVLDRVFCSKDGMRRVNATARVGGAARRSRLIAQCLPAPSAWCKPRW